MGAKQVYASFFDRIKAFSVDYIIILIYLGLVAVVAIFFIPSSQEQFTTHPKAQIMGFFLVTLPVSLYFFICETFVGGQTVGKKRIGIMVLKTDGKHITFFRGLFRTVLKFLPWELSHYLIYKMDASLGLEGDRLLYLMLAAIYLLVIIYIATAVMTKRKQSFYDLTTGTVVRKVSDEGTKSSNSKQ